jgi:hypothetical protein
MQRNKIYSVTFISGVARELGIEEDLLHEISLEMDREDGVIWVEGLCEESVMAFSDDR